MSLPTDEEAVTAFERLLTGTDVSGKTLTRSGISARGSFGLLDAAALAEAGGFTLWWVLLSYIGLNPLLKKSSSPGLAPGDD